MIIKTCFNLMKSIKDVSFKFMQELDNKFKSKYTFKLILNR